MPLTKLYETGNDEKPSIIIYRNKPDQVFVQFQDEGMSINDFTVDDILVARNAMDRVHDFEKNVDKLATKEQREAFQIVRNFLQRGKY